jgi:prepilin-type N-terminal cleavage/methylation domain-containing protein
MNEVFRSPLYAWIGKRRLDMSARFFAFTGHATPAVLSTSRCPTVARRRGFTLVELLVVIGIIALLISILLPSLSRAQRQGRSIKCLSNLRQFGQAQAVYAGQNKNWAIPVFMGAVEPVDVRITWPNNNDLRQALKQPVWQQGNGYGNR